MTLPRARFVWTPLTMTHAEVAEVVFRKCENWLRVHLSDYPTFPRPDSDGLYHAGKVKAWVDGRHGIVADLPADLTALARERAVNGPRARASSRP